jgi:NAD kinase
VTAVLDRLTENKIILVTRRTRLEDLVSRYGTPAQARFYIEHLGADFGEYLGEHERYAACRTEATTVLGRLGRLQVVDRAFLPNFLFGTEDVVVALGQDGLVANTMKYLAGHPLVGVNPDPQRWDGILLPFSVKDLMKIIPEVFARRRKVRDVTMAQAVLSNGQTLFAVNDLFIGPKTHTSALYTVRFGAVEEKQSSSGIIVSTGLGSTGWLKSVVVGAEGIVAGLTQRKVESRYRPVPWDSRYLHFTVREPFPSRHSGVGLVFGRIGEEETFTVVSHMAENGVIFSDGIEADRIEFAGGMTATVKVAERRGRLVC